MKKLLVLVMLIILVIFSFTTKALTVTESDLASDISEFYEVSDSFNENVKATSYYDNFLVTINDEEIILSITSHNKFLIDFKFDYETTFKLVDEKFYLDKIKVGFFKVPSFLEKFVIEHLASLDLDITNLDLAKIYDEADYKASISNNELNIKFTSSDKKYPEIHQDLIEIKDNKLIVDNHLLATKRFLDTLSSSHHITNLYYEDNILHLRVVEGFTYDYELEGEFELKGGKLVFKYDEIRLNDSLADEDIQKLFEMTDFKFSKFKKEVYFDLKTLESFINQYTTFEVEIVDLKMEDKLILSLAKK